jgi:crossover junction endodeoxyribonuclease RuvC
MIAGIDPGLTGALAFLDPDNPTTVATFDIPVHQLARGGKTKREIDAVGLAALLAQQPIAHAFVEAAGARPGQGTASMFAFGRAYGIVIGILAAHHTPLTLVAPGIWKRHIGVDKSKDSSRARASQLLPHCADQWPLKKDHGKAEACLLALYGVRMLNGTAERR